MPTFRQIIVFTTFVNKVRALFETKLYDEANQFALATTRIFAELSDDVFHDSKIQDVVSVFQRVFMDLTSMPLSVNSNFGSLYSSSSTSSTSSTSLLSKASHSQCQIPEWIPTRPACLFEVDNKIKTRLSVSDIQLPYRCVTVVSDRENGMDVALNRVLPNCKRVYCFKLLVRKIEKHLALDDESKILLKRLACTHTLSGFRYYRQLLASKSPQLLEFLRTANDLKFENWASCCMDYPLLVYKMVKDTENLNPLADVVKSMPPLLAIMNLMSTWQQELATRRNAQNKAEAEAE